MTDNTSNCWSSIKESLWQHSVDPSLKNTTPQLINEATSPNKAIYFHE